MTKEIIESQRTKSKRFLLRMKRQIWGKQRKSAWQAIDEYDVGYFESAVRGEHCIPLLDNGKGDLLTYAIEARFSDAVLAMCACGFMVMRHHIESAAKVFEEDEYSFFPKPRKLLKENKSIAGKLKPNEKRALYIGDYDSFVSSDSPNKEQEEKASWIRYGVESLKFLLATMKKQETDVGWKRLYARLRNVRIHEFADAFDPNVRYEGLGKKDFLFFCISSNFVASSRMVSILYPPKTNSIVFAVREYARNVGNAIRLDSSHHQRVMLHGKIPENLFETKEEEERLVGPMQKVLDALEIVGITSKYGGQEQVNSAWSGTTPMLSAVETRSSVLVEKLIKYGAYLNFVPEGATKLPLTATKDSDLAGLLVLNGANPDLADKEGNNMLSFSLHLYASEKVPKFAKKAFDLVRTAVSSKPNPDIPEREPPLVLAAKTENPSILEIVLSSGPNPNSAIFWAKDNGKKSILDRLLVYKRLYDLSLDDLVQKLEQTQKELGEKEAKIQDLFSVGSEDNEELFELKKKREQLRRDLETAKNVLRQFLIKSQMSFTDTDISRPRGIAKCLDTMGKNRTRVDYSRIRDKRAELRIQRYSERNLFDARKLSDGSDAGDFSDDQLFFFWHNEKPFVVGTWEIPEIVNGERKNPFTSEVLPATLLERMGSSRICSKSPGLEKELEFLFSRQLMGAQTLISFKEEKQSEAELQEKTTEQGEVEIRKETEFKEETEDLLDAAVFALKNLRL